MKILKLVLLGVVAVNAFAEVSEDARLAIRYGALGKYTYRVVDDEGCIVYNAMLLMITKASGAVR